MNIDLLMKRARLAGITDRAKDLDVIREMISGDFVPAPGMYAPAFVAGTTRALAWERAVRTTATSVPTIVQKSVAGLDFGALTWGDAKTNPTGVDDILGALALPALARNLATEYLIAGVAVVMASTPLDAAGRVGEAALRPMHGLNIPYTDPRDPSVITGWYRAVQYVHDSGHLAWWVEVYDWEGVPDGKPITHRVWRALSDPTHVGGKPDLEFASIARPRYMLAGVTQSGMPVSPMLANMGRVMGLYATELRLAASEEMSAFPMFKTKGRADFDAIGPAEVIAVSEGGDAEWMDPGKLEELREQVRLRRDQVREAFNLPGGALGAGAQVPSGEALQEANRGFMQGTRSTADGLSGLMSDGVTDYLALLGVAGVDVEIPIDREYMTAALLEVVEKGVDLQAVPVSVAARMFQTFLGASYSDDELAKFLEQKEADREAMMAIPGRLDPRDDTKGEDDEVEAEE